MLQSVSFPTILCYQMLTLLLLVRVTFILLPLLSDIRSLPSLEVTEIPLFLDLERMAFLYA